MPTKRKMLYVAAGAAASAAGKNKKQDETTGESTQSSLIASPPPSDPKRKKRKLGPKSSNTSTSASTKVKTKKNDSTKSIIDLSDVPTQPLILKNELSRHSCYKDNSRRRPVKEGSSKYTGVYYSKDVRKWKAQIMIGGKVRSLGYRSNEEEAAGLYSRAAFKYKSEGGNLHCGMDLSNIPEQPLLRNERSATGFRGVTKMKGRFQAKICRSGRLMALGTFDTPEDAAQIYVKALYHLEQEAAGLYSRAAFKCKSEGNNLHCGMDLSNIPEQPLLRNERSASGFKGVTKIKGGRYQAKICRGGRPMALGTFDTAEDAAQIYVKALYHLEQEAAGLYSRACKSEGNNLHCGMDLSNIPEQPLVRNESSASGFKGVTKVKDRFQAKVRSGGRTMTLGTFDTAEDAAQIRVKALYHLEQGGGSEGPTAKETKRLEGRDLGKSATDRSENDNRESEIDLLAI